MLFSKSKSAIGNDSNHNIVIQNSNVTNIISISPIETIELLRKNSTPEDMQRYVKSILSVAHDSHPLFPKFSATYNPDLQKLVSTPETADAFDKHPKKIKGTFLIDYEKYPYMDKSETPWEYAYRTQTNVVLDTKAYKEYLGDTEDPFPVIEYSEGMKTTIGFNEFPPAIETIVKSGNIAVSIMLRRKPSLKYGELIFGNVSSGHGFEITIHADKFQKNTTINFLKVEDCDLKTHLVCEELLYAIYTTKKLSIIIGNFEPMNAIIDEAQLESNIFKNAKILKVYIKNLLTIEKHTNCKFNPNIGEVSFDDVENSIIIAASLEEKWRMTKLSFDNSVRCDYNNIPDDIADCDWVNSETVVEMKVLSINLHGESFTAEKFTIVYKDAKIKNIASVLKNKKRKKKDILLTMKPIDGKDVFYKYVRMSNITHIPQK